MLTLVTPVVNALVLFAMNMSELSGPSSLQTKNTSPVLETATSGSVDVPELLLTLIALAKPSVLFAINMSVLERP